MNGHCHCLAKKLKLFLLVMTTMMLTRETRGFNSMLVKKRTSVQPSLLTSRQRNHDASSFQRSSLHSPLYYRNRHDEAETNVDVQENKQYDRDDALESSANQAATMRRQQRGIPLVGAILLAQFFTLTVASTLLVIGLFVTGHPIDFNSLGWNFDPSHFVPLFHCSLTPIKVVEGILATVPMVYLGTLVEKSDGRDESHVNFSTMNMVMTLFGRRRAAIEVPGSSNNFQSIADFPHSTIFQMLPIVALLTIVTGFTEEVVFRGQLPSLLYILSGGSTVVALIGQALMFGLGHYSIRGTDGENRLVCTFQTVNALWYGVVYLAAGGDIVPCIIAHILYDAHVFVQTWMTVNDQMDYTERKLDSTSSATNVKLIQESLREVTGPDFVLDDETLDFTRRFFYNFDHEHKGTLSRFDVQRAVSYAFLQASNQPSQDVVNTLMDWIATQKNEEKHKVRLNLVDFLKILFILKSNRNATIGKQLTM